jgi:hypothetical protein
MLNKNLRSKAENGGFLRKNHFDDIFKKPDDNSFNTAEEETIFECACDDGGETLSYNYNETNGGKE